MGVKVLVFGQAGLGKTTLCATAPAPVIFSAESGLLSLTRHNLPYYEIKTMMDLREAFSWARSSVEAKQFQTLCIDSISDIAETVLSDAKARNKDGRMAYGTMIDEMTAIIKNFRDLPSFNVYMTAKMERIKNEAMGTVLNAASMPGAKLGANLPYFPDLVLKIDIEGFAPNSYRVLRCHPSLVDDCKDRSGALNPIEEPHLGKLFDKITAYSAQ